MSAVLILNISSWRVFNVPWEKNAASAAGILLTTECVITDTPKKESESVSEQPMF